MRMSLPIVLKAAKSIEVLWSLPQCRRHSEIGYASRNAIGPQSSIRARSTQLGLNRRLIALADVTLETLFWEWKGGRASFKFSPLNST